MNDISSTARVELKVNGKEADEQLSKLRKRARELGDEIVKAMTDGDEKGLKRLRKEAKEVDKAIKRIESSTQQAANVLQRLDKSTPKELQSTLRTLNKQLEHMTRGTKEWTDQVDKIKRVKGALKEVTEELSYQQTFLQRLNGKFSEWGAMAMAAAASLTGVVAAAKKAVSTYAEMDQEMANVRKYTGMTADEVDHLNEQFKKIDTRTSRDELNKLAQEAGRLGLQSEEDVLGFVRAADKINVALDDLGEGATLTLSKLTDIFGDKQRLGTEQSLLSVGSVINELSQNCTASAPYLAQFAQRLAGVGAQANMTVPQIMAFGAVLDSQGQAVEMSATALSKTITSLFKNTDKICAATGLNVKQFGELAKKDTNEALLVLLERLHDMGDMSVLAPIFAEMGENGSRATGVLAALAGNIDLVRKQQLAANEAFTEATSIDAEFNVQNNTVQAGLEKARKGFQEMAVTLGERLMPIVSHLISGTSATMRLLNTTLKFVDENRIAIISLAAGVATYTIAVNAATIKTKAHNAVVKLATAAQKAWNMAVKGNPWALLASAIVAAGTAIALFIRKQNQATELQKTMRDAQKKITEQYNEQRAKVQMLTDAVHNETASLKNRKAALEELKRLVPGYHADLTEEGRLINDNKSALDDYLATMEREIQMQVYREKLEELYRKRMTAQDDLERAQGAVKTAEENAAAHAGEVQVRTGQGAAGPTGGVVNSYAAAVKEARGNLEYSTNQLREIDNAIVSISNRIKDVPGAFTSGGTNNNHNNTSNTPSDDKSSKNKFQAEDDWREREDALNRIAYAKGEKDYEAYQKRMLEIEIEYNSKKLAHNDLVGNERVTIEAAYQEALMKQQQNYLQLTEEQENERHQDALMREKQRYANGEISKEVYDTAIQQLELAHLKNLRDIQEEGSDAWLKADRKYNDAVLSDQIARQQKQLATEKKTLSELERLRQEFFDGRVQISDKAGFDAASQQLDLLRSEMLAQAKTNKEKLQIEKAYHEARYLLARRYNVKAAEADVNAFRMAIDKSVDWLNSDGGQAMQGAMSVMVNSMGEIFSGLSDLIQAETEIQTAAIEQQYDNSISAAEGNKYETARLEKEKEAEIAKVKNEANKKMFAMQVTQAIAQGAMSAISAYSSAAAIPMIGWIMAPIAAGMSLAATAIQIAAIKKQQQASEATGYADGGYTRKGGKYEPAGIVHAGEWVASQELLANPAAAATIGMLDHAQKTNTIGQLDAGMVSQTITAPVRLAAQPAAPAAAPQSTSGSSSPERTSDALDRLADRLDRPFVTVATVTGDRGINHEMERYNQLMRNKSPKR